MIVIGLLAVVSPILIFVLLAWVAVLWPLLVCAWLWWSYGPVVSLLGVITWLLWLVLRMLLLNSKQSRSREEAR